jgi:hypothetical protein
MLEQRGQDFYQSGRDASRLRKSIQKSLDILTLTMSAFNLKSYKLYAPVETLFVIYEREPTNKSKDSLII